MGLFSLFAKKPNSEWCVILSNREYASFMSQVKEAAEAIFPGATFDTDIGLLNRPSGEQISLFNLARMWKQADAEARKVLIPGFLEEISGYTNEPVPFDVAEPNLRTRLYPYEEAMAGFPSCLRVIENSILEILVIDGERSIRSVFPEEIETWGKSLEELGQIGRANVFAQENAAVERTMVESLSVTMVAGENFYVASQALELERFVISDDSPHGALLVIPTRSMFTFAPVVPELLMGSIQFLEGYARHFFLQESGGVSEGVFWWKEGQITKLTGSHLPDELEAFI